MTKKYIAIVFIFSCFCQISAQYKKREMRAVWIATVANIDWPSKKNLSPKDQKQEMTAMLDEFVKNNINAIIIQIRPTADAFYPSTLEPWSHWLTGKQGAKPSPYYDPLEFIVEEAHKRCIEVHAWLNPYRVTNSENTEHLSKHHKYFQNPEMFLKYGGKTYFNPGLDETRQFLNKVVQEVVKKYDIDAIHFDDYFYPYKYQNEVFPDEDTFHKYPRGFTNKNDWRRNNVNLVIAELSQTIKNTKPWVEFGISPFGVWRNKSNDPRGSATAATQNYDDLYADILKWLEEGTIDYVAPQLYWEIGKKNANYEVLVKWWSDNSYNKNLYIGLYNSNLGVKEAPSAWHRGNELVRQLNMNKNYSQIDGAAFYSANAFMKNKFGLNDSLKSNFYKYPSLTPICRNIKGEEAKTPTNIKIHKEGSKTFLRWDDIKDSNHLKAAYYVVYAFEGNSIGDINDPTKIAIKTYDNSADITNFILTHKAKFSFTVTTVNRYKHESTPSVCIISPQP
jgi:uncharacterized lipoprotein YddW (UPF0748 family)